MNIYQVSKEVVTRKPQWPAGESTTVYEQTTFKAYIAEYKQQLFLCAVNGDPAKVVRVKAGYLSPARGWQWSLSKRGYRLWVARAKRLVNGR